LFTVAYCPLYFDYGVYSEMIMNFRIAKAMHLILFNHMSPPYSQILRTLNLGCSENRRVFWRIQATD